jgi:hypothetical protein
MDGYTVGELVWLLALRYKDALEEDLPGSSLMRADGGGGRWGGDPTRIPTLARWSEVHAAKERVVRRRRDAIAAELLAQGYVQAEVASLLETSQQTVSRRFRATLREILDELGGPRSSEDASSRVPLCLICGRRPRARAAAVTRNTLGGVQVLRAERDVAVCDGCGDSSFVRVLTDRAAA